MKRVFIVHGWGGSPEMNWLPWLQKELEARSFEVHVPGMPDPDTPRIEVWVSKLAQEVGQPDSNTYFVGHSIGSQTILRYLEQIDTAIGGVLHVAGWFTLNLEPEEETIAQPWLTTPINYEKIKHVAPKMIALFSEDDPSVPLENKDLFEQRLQAKTIIEKNAGHFTGEEDGRTEYPIILESFLSLAQ
ncbi:MAG: alpha/beta hydrolase [Candidatus Yanofskybacteria bacterium]|nr:alpha/beta hydrolase [Candidatus Yanofskybacteria bacterium]